MMNKRTWVTRVAVVSLTATALSGVGAGVAVAGGCSPSGPSRPDGTITVLLKPLIGSPYDFPGTQPLGMAPFVVTGLLDAVIDPVLCTLGNRG